MLSYAVCRASHPPFFSNKNQSLPQKEVHLCFLLSPLLFPKPFFAVCQAHCHTGLEIIKNDEKFRKWLTFWWSVMTQIILPKSILSFFNPKSNPPSLRFRAGVSKGEPKLKLELMGCPGHLVGKKRASPLKWKCEHMEGEQAHNLHSLLQTTAADPTAARPLGLCLLPYPFSRAGKWYVWQYQHRDTTWREAGNCV